MLHYIITFKSIIIITEIFTLALLHTITWIIIIIYFKSEH